jgi:hypothetical protein
LTVSVEAAVLAYFVVMVGADFCSLFVGAHVVSLRGQAAA